MPPPPKKKEEKHGLALRCCVPDIYGPFARHAAHIVSGKEAIVGASALAAYVQPDICACHSLVGKCARGFRPHTQESCRLCKEENHIPLRCDEVEKKDVENFRTALYVSPARAALCQCESLFCRYMCLWLFLNGRCIFISADICVYGSF
jgi:hypothetical protein